MDETPKKIVFQNSSAALNYVCEFFTHQKIKGNNSFIGVIRDIDIGDSHDIYAIEICAQKNSLLSKKVVREIVMAEVHPELEDSLNVDDFIEWGFNGFMKGIPTGYILKKLSLELDVQSGQFLQFDSTLRQSHWKNDSYDYDAAELSAEKMHNSELSNRIISKYQEKEDQQKIFDDSEKYHTISFDDNDDGIWCLREDFLDWDNWIYIPIESHYEFTKVVLKHSFNSSLPLTREQLIKLLDTYKIKYESGSWFDSD